MATTLLLLKTPQRGKLKPIIMGEGTDTEEDTDTEEGTDTAVGEGTHPLRTKCTIVRPHRPPRAPESVTAGASASSAAI